MRTPSSPAMKGWIADAPRSPSPTRRTLALSHRWIVSVFRVPLRAPALHEND
jgi:hypothetical protein